MPIRVNCPSCQRALRVPDHLIGEKIKCPSCTTQFISGGEEDLDQGVSYVPVQAAPEPASPRESPRRAAREDEDWDDDFRRRRRRKRRRNRDSASGQLLGPAIGLMATAILGLMFALFCVIVGPVALEDAADAEEKADAIRLIIAGPIELIASLVVLVGSIAMLRLRNYNLAMAGSVVALVPCMSPCCFVGIPFGIWGMIILSQPDTKHAFR